MRKLLMILAAFCLLAGCAKAEISPTPEPPSPTPAPVPTPRPVTTPSPTPVPTPTPEPLIQNPLTGEALADESELGRRPTAIMLNNIKKALPMSGVSQADVLYETLAEGGITRMLGVYYNPDELTKIGTVRSARTYYLELALGHDAIFIHAGGSYLVYNELKAWGVKSLDYVNGGSYTTLMAWRDAVRKKNVGSEHSVYTSGAHLLAAIEKTKLRTEQAEGFTLGWSFRAGQTPEGGTAAGYIEVPFTSKKSTCFTYQPDTMLYTAEQYNAVFYDEEYDAQVAVTNVLVLYTSITKIPGDSEGRLKTVLTGTGTGWWAAGGTAIPIQWSKATRDDPFVFTDEAGQAITLATGKSYIGIIDTAMTAKFN